MGQGVPTIFRMSLTMSQTFLGISLWVLLNGQQVRDRQKKDRYQDNPEKNTRNPTKDKSGQRRFVSAR